LVAHADGIEVVDALAPLLDRFDLIGVDMPIGLPDTPLRAADREARRFLAHRRSTVFDVPTRAVLAATSHTEANATSRRLYGRGISVQAFHLFPRIREVDALDAAALARQLVEIHPECAFARMAGAPLPPKRSAAGRDARLALVEAFVGLQVRDSRLPGARSDDVLDACAVLWSARRFAAGTAVTFGDGSYDARGLPMRIVS
jgi:predicted RNase H-like nuclease